MISKLLVSSIFAALVFNLIVEVPAESPITRRVLFIVDNSGSMHGDHFTNALNAFKDIITTPTDDLEFAVVAFNAQPYRWPGKPEDGDHPVPPGWARLPSETAVEEAQSWLKSMGAGGDTLLIPALRMGLSELRPEMSVILVTDGLFGRERSCDIHNTIAGLQAHRDRVSIKGEKIGRAVIGVYGLGPNQTVLREIAERGRGGFFREENPPIDELQDLDLLHGR